MWLLITALPSGGSVLAASSSKNQPPESFIQSYGTSTTIQEGMIVQLVKNNSNNVQVASQNNPFGTFGVVVNVDDASIALTNPTQATTNQVYVTTGSQYNVLVSDQNGGIKVGDYITLSSVNGIGMKDNTTSPIVVGQALAPLTNTTPIVGSTSIKNSLGKSITVHFALIKTNIAIAKNPELVATSSSVPSILTSLSHSITGKTVAAWRIYLGLAVLAVVAFIVGSMMYSAVRNSLTAIGRNPLSKKAITKAFIQVVLSALIIFTSSIFGVYLLLKV